jgi:hypothetical protein
MRILIFLALIFATGYLYPQDTTINKSIKTEQFNLSAEYLVNFVSNSNMKVKDYYDCTKITPSSDSGFVLYHKSGNNSILYKDIKDITFVGKNKFGKGLWKGAVIGTLAALITDLIVFTSADLGDRESGFYAAAAGILLIPASAIAGMIVGGIIGAFLHDKTSYNFSKYPLNKKKEMFLNILNKNKLNL